MKKILKKINWWGVAAIIYMILAFIHGYYLGLQNGYERGFVFGKITGYNVGDRTVCEWYNSPDTNWQEFIKPTKDFLYANNFDECWDSLTAENIK